MHKTPITGKEKYFLPKMATIFLTVLALDQTTKYLFSTRTITLIPKIIELTPTTNTGSAFGLLQWVPNIFYIILSATVIIAGLALIKKRKLPLTITTLFITGVTGNIIDRIFYGYVRDFIAISIWPSFNIADSAMVIAVILYILQTISAE